MVKFLHTADWHLGIKYLKLGSNAERARDTRIETIAKLMDAAKKYKVDFILVAGDLFDNNDVDRGLIEVAENLIKRAAPIQVYILPGNHDPLTRDSLYLDESWDSLGNATILKNKERIEVPKLNVTLYPCPSMQKQTREDITEWIAAKNDTISIGVAHGNLQIEGFVEDPNFPIDPRRVDESALDYLALGEWHSLSMHEAKDKSVRTVYPGTPEATKFGETKSGKAVIVEIQNHGAKPIIREIDVGTTKWEEWTRDVFSIDDIKRIETELNTIREPDHTALNLRLKGVIDQEVEDYSSLLESKYFDSFLYFSLVREDLHLKPNISKLKAMIPEGVIFEKTIMAIQSLMKCQPSLQEHCEMPPEEAEEVLREIRHIDSAVNATPEMLERALLHLYQAAKDVSK